MNQQSNKILVSVIIPTYKPGAYLQECIESICQQTIAKEVFELIIVLNGCDEPYRSNINTFLAKCQGNINVRVLQTDQPGVSNARNMGIDEAQGEFICFIDDDDWVSANYLEELINVAQDGADIVASNVLCYSDETGLYTEDYITRAFKRISSPSNIPILQARSFMSSSCCKIIRREKIGCKRFDCHFRIGEDSLFMASISNKTKHISKSSPKAVYYRRLRKSSASRTTTSLSAHIKNACHLTSAYTRILMSDILHYNWLFFASRYVALLLNILRGS
ncbi:MAG: glycosyltransferase family 2 protein [Bacteroidaceae bacterium]|nr:glycosyltransferase family 2 protein [Bacteroidaceae bacterium]